MRSRAIKDRFHIRLDDEGTAVSYPLVGSRCRWAGLLAAAQDRRVPR